MITQEHILRMEHSTSKPKRKKNVVDSILRGSRFHSVFLYS
jgi:hypothetical protein